MNDDTLDAILDVDPDETRTTIQRAAEIIHAEVVTVPPAENISLISASPAENISLITASPAAMSKPDPHNADLKDDVDYAREQIKDLIDQGRVAVQGALELAEAGDSPRAYEVVATMITAIVNANKELIVIHKTKKDATRESAQSGPILPGGAVNIDKAIFVGRSSDLLRELKAARAATEAADVTPPNVPE